MIVALVSAVEWPGEYCLSTLPKGPVWEGLRAQYTLHLPAPLTFCAGRSVGHQCSWDPCQGFARECTALSNRALSSPDLFNSPLFDPVLSPALPSHWCFCLKLLSELQPAKDAVSWVLKGWHRPGMSLTSSWLLLATQMQAEGTGESRMRNPVCRTTSQFTAGRLEGARWHGGEGSCVPCLRVLCGTQAASPCRQARHPPLPVSTAGCHYSFLCSNFVADLTGDWGFYCKITGSTPGVAALQLR